MSATIRAKGGVSYCTDLFRALLRDGRQALTVGLQNQIMGQPGGKCRIYGIQKQTSLRRQTEIPCTGILRVCSVTTDIVALCLVSCSTEGIVFVVLPCVGGHCSNARERKCRT